MHELVRDNAADLVAFVAVASERSFTRGAASLGVSQSALSRLVRGLETRLGVRLLTRTTRSVALTEAGEMLFSSLRPRFQGIESDLEGVLALRDSPGGTLRITAGEHATTAVWPRLAVFIEENPLVKVEIVADNAFVDIVAERYDAGIRMAHMLDRDMIAVPVGPDLRMAVVAAPAYFERMPVPRAPQDLAAHDCINLRLPDNRILPWEFEKDGRELRLRVKGRLVFNNSSARLAAALAGSGIAYFVEDQTADHVASGRLVRVLEDWCAPFPGYYLYYANRRNQIPAFTRLVEALRYRA
ncbi:MAG: LysR family transcriptional regulator [Bauldia sp.]|nr:LysR family transcriptional regulator [Bauldia sp.]